MARESRARAEGRFVVDWQLRSAWELELAIRRARRGARERSTVPASNSLSPLSGIAAARPLTPRLAIALSCED